MVRSVSDTILYRCSDDKYKYLQLIKKYQEIFAFKVYAYCIMDTHAHIIIDCCGADISKIMHDINQCYAQYYNRKYNRRGHLFQDRFKSKVVHNEAYLITLSGYIHNNPADMKEYKNKVEKYRFSSLGIYLGIRTDSLNLVDSSFVMQLFSKNKSNARLGYLRYINTCNEESLKIAIETNNDESTCLSERKIVIRNLNPSSIIDFLWKFMLNNIKNHTGNLKDFKAISCYILRRFCGLNFKDICNYLDLISESYASKLCFYGLSLLTTKDEYKDIINNIA